MRVLTAVSHEHVFNWFFLLIFWAYSTQMLLFYTDLVWFDKVTKLFICHCKIDLIWSAKVQQIRRTSTFFSTSGPVQIRSTLPRSYIFYVHVILFSFYPDLFFFPRSGQNSTQTCLQHLRFPYLSGCHIIVPPFSTAVELFVVAVFCPAYVLHLEGS